MKFTWKTLTAACCYAIGVLGWCYVGGWMILTKPVKRLVITWLAGEFSIGGLIAAVIQAFIYLSLAGGIWCVGYILSNYFKEN